MLEYFGVRVLGIEIGFAGRAMFSMTGDDKSGRGCVVADWIAFDWALVNAVRASSAAMHHRLHPLVAF